MGKVIIHYWEIPSLIVLLLLLAVARVAANPSKVNHRMWSLEWNLFEKFYIHIFRTGEECGVRLLGSTPLIHQGTPTKPGDWSWHVALFQRSIPEPVYACGGTIISNNFVLTAAHCFREKNPDKYFFKAGVHHLYNETDPRVVRYKVLEIILHPKYSAATYYHDIALIRPDGAIQYKPGSVLPICLWSQLSDHDMLQDKLAGIVAGFGKTEENKVSEVLQQTAIRIISKEECRKLLPANTHYLMEDDSKLCGVGKSSGSNVCEGDSGGGLYAGANTIDGVVWYLRGIVSAAPRKDHTSGVTTCDANLPAVYTNVEKYSGWIAAHEKIVDERNLLKDAKCGVVRNVNVANETDKPLFNQYPWNALLEFTHVKKNSVVLLCSGVLIHRRYVLTVGHCTQGITNKFKLRSVRLGEFNVQTRDDTDASAPHQTFRASSIDIEAVILHPKINEPPYSNDLALLKLKHDADTAKENILPICLPSLDEYKELSVTLTGWTRSKHIFPTMQRDAMNISSTRECQDQYGKLLLDLPYTDEMVCASYNNRPKGSCHNYAAGSPLQYIKKVDKHYHYFLAGLMVFSLPNCRTNATEVFVNLNGATEWIKTTVLS